MADAAEWLEAELSTLLSLLEGTSRAPDIARAIGLRSGELRGLDGLGHLGRDEFGPAVDYFTQARGIARVIGHHTGDLDSLIASGHVHRVTGQHQQGTDHLVRRRYPTLP
jgi:hypothetical protein